MMNFDELHIHSLLVEKASGSIDPEMDAFMDQLIEEDEDIRAQWEEIRQALDLEDPETAQRLNAIDWKPAEALMAPHRPVVRRLPRLVLRVAAAAAVIAGLAAGIYLWKQPWKSMEAPSDVNQIAAMSAARQQVTLTLASGQQINLSQVKDSVVAGSSLHSTGKQLSYSIDNAGAAEVSGINTLMVPIGKDYHLKLSDGTEVWLNSATRMEFRFLFSGNTREISINGEAFLQVAKDASRPFIVHTPKGSVQVLGTSFNLNTYDSSRVSVALLEGSVKFSYEKRSVAIKPGSMATGRSDADIAVTSFDKEDVLGWLGGMYYFTNTPLEEIIKVMPRWYGIQVAIDNKSLNHQIFTGGMDRSKPLTFFLNNLKQTMPIDYSFDKDGVLHLK